MTFFGPDATFSFLRPLWLLGFLALPLLAWGFQRSQARSGWERYIPADKLRHLEIESVSARARRQSWILLALALAFLALAGPSWRKLPVPVGQSRDAMIIAFDLSPSMLATDIAPDRLTRARLKVIDLLRRRQDGETALIAYSGGAHRVAPLTDDAETIEVLVPSLHPNVMPNPGSEVESAVGMASELLTGAALERATLVLITDGIASDAYAGIEARLAGRLDLCLLVVGSDESVPIPLPGGGFLRNARGQTQLSRIDRGALRRFAAAQNGCYAELRSDDADLNEILRFAAAHADAEIDESDRTFDVRQDEGFWLALILLPVALVAFRKNVLWMLLPIGLLSGIAPAPATAYEWADLWQRADQRAADRIESGIDEYRAGRFAEAAEQFSATSKLDHYNRGNALTQQGQLQEAVASYASALEIDPEFEEAAHNKALLEEFMEQQEQEQSPQEQSPPEDEADEENAEQESSEDGEPSDESQGSQSSDSDSDSESESQSPSSDDAQQSDEERDDSASGETEPGDESQTEDEAGDSPEERREEEMEAEPSADASAQEEPTPLSDQSEQWLRNIPDDPGGLLRRKFQYEAELRRRSGQQRAPHERY